MFNYVVFVMKVKRNLKRNADDGKVRSKDNFLVSCINITNILEKIIFVIIQSQGRHFKIFLVELKILDDIL